MHLFLVRHGECVGQVDPTCRTPDSELTARGENQARQTAQRLAAAGITHIVSSPLARCLTTATILQAAVGCPNVTVWTDLRECWTEPFYTGPSRQQLQARFPTANLPPEITANGWSHGGDSYTGMFTRSQRVVERLHDEFAADARIVLVTHGGIGNYLLHVLLGLTLETPRWFELANCAISQVRLCPIKGEEEWDLYPPTPVQLLSLNDRAHLDVA
ncbi:MAG: histidine phosphatase family protein [Caldilineaceae bacterium]